MKSIVYIESIYVAPDAAFQELVAQQGSSLCTLHRSVFLGIPPNLENIQKYNRQQLLGSCQIMGVKIVDAKVVTKSLFQQLVDKLKSPISHEAQGSIGQIRSLTVAHSFFQQCAKRALAATKHRSPDHLGNFNIACEIESRRRSITVLLGGASGTGKSTLASLVASRLGISTVLSTDSIRHILRCVISPESNPILFCSTYETHKYVHNPGLSVKQACTVGHQRQCECVYEHLRAVIADYNYRKESLVVEGVHLSVDIIKKLMKSFSSVLPFVIIIKDKDKHKERFAVRSKCMTLDPKLNKYIAYFSNICAIQKKFIAKADEVLIPKIDNSNVDRSLGLIHATIVKTLKKMAEGVELYDRMNKRCAVLHELFTMVSRSAWSSKEAQEIINSKANKGELFQRFFKGVTSTPQKEEEDVPKPVENDSSDKSNNEGPEVGSLFSGSVDVDLLQSRVESMKKPAVDEAILSQHSDEEWPEDDSCRAASPGSYSSEGSAHSSQEEGQAEDTPNPSKDAEGGFSKRENSHGRSKSAPRNPAAVM